MGFFKKLFRDTSRDDEFMKLCANGTLQDVKEALNSWGYLEAKNDKGASTLMASCFNPDSEVTRLILEKFIESGNKSAVNDVDANKWTPLHFAGSFATNPETVRILVQAGGMINSLDSQGETPLMHAASFSLNGALKDNIEVIKVLIEESKKNGRGLEIQDKNGSTVLNRAAQLNTRPEILDMLIEAGANLETKDSNGYTPMMSATLNPSPEIIRFFAKKGAKLDVRDRDGLPIVFTCISHIIRSSQDKDNKFPITIEHLKALIESGADVDAKIPLQPGQPIQPGQQNSTALTYAAATTLSPEIMKLLADYTKDINMPGSGGMTAYALALGMENKFASQATGIDPSSINQANNQANIEILKAHGAKIGFAEMCKFASPERVKTAIKDGADVDGKNSDGMTPLMLAFIDNPDPEVVLALIDAGADLNARDDKQGFTLLDIAIDMERYKEAAILEKFGARPNIYRR